MIKIRVASDGAFQFFDDDFIVTSIPPGFVGKDNRVIPLDEYRDAMIEFVEKQNNKTVQDVKVTSMVELIGMKPSKIEVTF